MDKSQTWNEMLESIKELEKSLDTTHYLSQENWKKLAKELNL